MPSSLGTTLNVRVLRANGVNTAVAIFDSQGRALVPLVVEFPIEKRGVFREMALLHFRLIPLCFRPTCRAPGVPMYTE